MGVPRAWAKTAAPVRGCVGSPLDDGGRVRGGAVHDVVVPGEQLPQDGGDPELSLSGELDLHRGVPGLAPVVDRHDHPVGQVQRPTANPLAEFPFADPAEAHRLRLGSDETNGVAVGGSDHGGFVRPPRETGGRPLPTG